MDIQRLLRANQLTRKQKGQRFETPTAFYLRYYCTTDDGKRKQKAVLLAHKSDLYRSWHDVEPLIQIELHQINKDVTAPTGRTSLAEFVENVYLPWVEETKSAPTAYGYRRVWNQYWKPYVGALPLTDLQTSHVTAVLDKHAKGLGGRTLSHIKWMLSGVFVYAIAKGVVPKNPVPDAKWTLKVARPTKQAEYTLETILAMLKILEPLNLQAAVAVALAYFAALRPAEIRGLQWADYDGAELSIRRGVWRGIVGETKTADSASTVPVIEPLKSLLEKLRAQTPDGFMLQNSAGKPLSLDSLNMRVVTPAMAKAGIAWHGYYPGRRGISGKVTDTSKNALNSTGLLRHSTPITALKHYTRAQKDSIEAAMKQIETLALDLMAKESETVQ